jgi:hypothetical protein
MLLLIVIFQRHSPFLKSFGFPKFIHDKETKGQHSSYFFFFSPARKEKNEFSLMHLAAFHFMQFDRLRKNVAAKCNLQLGKLVYTVVKSYRGISTAIVIACLTDRMQFAMTQAIKAWIRRQHRSLFFQLPTSVFIAFIGCDRWQWEFSISES